MGWRAEECWGGKSETVQGLRSMRPSAHEGSLQLERTPSLRADAGVGQGTGLGKHSTGWIALDCRLFSFSAINSLLQHGGSEGKATRKVEEEVSGSRGEARLVESELQR